MSNRKQQQQQQQQRRKRIEGSLYGMAVGDAVAVCGHWYYSPAKLRKDYCSQNDDGGGGTAPTTTIEGILPPKLVHPESMVQGMSYEGSIDILHDKAVYYAGHKLLANEAKKDKKLSEEEAQEARLRDDHGNYVGATEDERVHYHRTLRKGQNTANACLARLAIRYLARANGPYRKDRYDPDEYMNRLYEYMVAKPPTTTACATAEEDGGDGGNNNDDDDDREDAAQHVNHNDTYLDVYLRGLFTNASRGVPLPRCALSQRDTWSIGSLDGVVMSIPIVAAYSYEPESYVVGRAVEHHMLTHRSVTVTAGISVLAPLLLELYAGSELRAALDRAMDKMRPPRITGREMRNSYVKNRGPGNIPRDKKWQQHMVLVDESEGTTKDLVHKLIESGADDEDVAGWGDRPNSRLSTACYVEQALAIVFFLAYKYFEDPRKALLQNVMLGGHSTARGAVLGAILGAAHGADAVPFVDELAAPSAVAKEVKDLVDTVCGSDTMIPIVVKTADGKEIALMVDRSHTLSEIKMQLGSELGLPAQNERLFKSGNEIADNAKTAADYGLEAGSVLDMEPKSFSITIEMHDGETFQIETSPSDPIDSINAKIAERTGMAVPRQVLKLNGEVVVPSTCNEGKKLVRDIGINQDGETIQCYIRTIRITVKTHDGKTLLLDVEPSSSIDTIKKLIQEKAGIEPKRQYLRLLVAVEGADDTIEGKKELSNGKKTVEQCGIEAGSVLMLELNSDPIIFVDIKCGTLFGMEREEVIHKQALTPLQNNELDFSQAATSSAAKEKILKAMLSSPTLGVATQLVVKSTEVDDYQLGEAEKVKNMWGVNLKHREKNKKGEEFIFVDPKTGAVGELSRTKYVEMKFITPLVSDDSDETLEEREKDHVVYDKYVAEIRNVFGIKLAK